MIVAINVKDKLVTVEGVKAAFDIEAGARSDADEALSARIDNIVTPEGDPSLTEISDARVNNNGTTYNSLKARLDADVSVTEAELSKISTNLSEQTGVRILSNWASGYYRLDGDPTGITTSTITSASNYICTYEECSAGDIYLYTGKGTSAARRYAFLSSNSGQNNIISISGSSTQLMNDYMIIAPAGANYIIINTDKRVDYSVKKIGNRRFISENDDLNDYREKGTYFCRNASVASSLSNLPSDGINIGFRLTVSSVIELNDNVSVMQTLVCNSTVSPRVYKRIYLASLSQWGSWHRIYETEQDTLLEIQNLTPIDSGTDLNDMKQYGSYYCQNATVAKTIKNLPFFVDSSFSLYVINSHKADTNEKYVRQIIFGNKISLSSIYTRALNIDWGDWQLLINASIHEQPRIIEATNFTYNKPVGTVKKTINVATNNVAHYWCQGRSFADETPRYLADVPIRIAQWKRWLLHSKIDLLFLQECEDYIDHGYSGHAKTMNAFNYLYSPFFDSDDEIEVVSEGTVLPQNRIDTQSDTTSPSRRKILNRLGLQTITHGGVEQKGCVILNAVSEYTGKGYYNWRIVQLDGVGKILLINVHNFAGLDTIDTRYSRRLDRKSLLDNLESLIASKKTQVGYDYFIIAGDFNAKLAKANLSQSDIEIMDSNYQGWKDDREYILDFCSNISGVPVNGGIIGWFTTISQEESSNAYDNIIVSNNIRIEDIHCDPALVPAGFLHTDHTPVSAAISFIDVTI